MSVSLTANFLSHARGFTLADGGGITWTLDKNTNKITGTTGSGGGLSGANPSASVGLTAVNGSAVTYMRSDAAPALSQAIVPTWSGAHVFQAGLSATTPPAGASITVTPNTGKAVYVYDQANLPAATTAFYLVGGYSSPVAGRILFGDGSGWSLHISKRTGSATTDLFTFADSGALTVAGEFAINGGAPTAKLTGFGTPSGTVTSGLSSSSTLAQTAGTLAALLAYLKTIGFIGT